MFPLQNFAYALCRQLSTVKTSNSPFLAHDPLIPRYDKLLHDRYSDIVFLIKQITKQHYNFDHDWKQNQ